MILRDYQTEIADKGAEILRQFKIVYLSMEVRVGKTATALQTADTYGAKFVVFVTTIKARPSIEADYADLVPGFKLRVTNFEQLHNFDFEGYDLLIIDEAHKLGQFPKPANRTRLLKNLCAGLPIIYLSGTPTPESYSQIFFQFWISSFSPFEEDNFYKWSKIYCNPKVKYVYNRQINDYSDGRWDLIEPKVRHLFLSYTQKEAGFVSMVEEHILKVDMKVTTMNLARRLLRDKVVEGRAGELILGDTAVKMQNKLHQIFSGTVKSEDGNGIPFDDSKAHFIKHYFRGKKIAIFYKFQAELELIKKQFGDLLVDTPEAFRNQPDAVFCSQIQAGREGIDLQTADALIMFNIDFSSLSYQQARARIQAKDKTTACPLYWIFSAGGMEEKIYDVVINKQDYTTSYFRKDYKVSFKKQNHEIH